ncbi:hypothetical protein BJF81_03330 [Ornithinimicrobium sp. CNJ-824]|nr:hypothetical protein BJF81_03330 [Ornithinimicrobium sp. CNJ-824]
MDQLVVQQGGAPSHEPVEVVPADHHVADGEGTGDGEAPTVVVGQEAVSRTPADPGPAGRGHAQPERRRQVDPVQDVPEAVTTSA